MSRVTVVGGGLAGSEAAWRLAEAGVEVRLIEMRPVVSTAAHTGSGLGELVCSNSLRGTGRASAVGVLKEEMQMMGSLVMQAAQATQVPAGGALAVDREAFSAWITQKLESHPRIAIERREVTAIPEHGSDAPVVLASGPLTSAPLHAAIETLTGEPHIAFFDAIAPIVDAETVDMNVCWWGSRYGKGGDDYLNCPMDRMQYETFVDALLEAEKVPLHEFEDTPFFEGCMPVEVMAERGRETLRFGPMKPVGLTNPRNGQIYHAVVQLRQDNRRKSLLNMVGFQTKMTYPAQQRVLRTIPGLENAEFFRMGSVHRNTFIRAPRLLDAALSLKGHPGLHFAGQITGVEGYVESAATGMWVGEVLARRLSGQGETELPPPTTALGSLLRHLLESEPDHFAPSNVHFGLFAPLEGIKGRRGVRRAAMGDRAIAEFAPWLGIEPPAETSEAVPDERSGDV